MSAWIVYSKDGKTERCRLKALEYSGSFMADRAVTATFEYHSEVAFEVFDYIVYRGEKFELESVPSVKKTSSDRYEYELRFVSLKYELERCEMRDIVPNDNGVVYPTPLTFSFTGDVRYLAERIQVNLDALYGEGVWHISVAENTTSEEKNITIGQQNCWNALSLVNTTYGLNFSVRGREVLIGGELDSVNHEFQYGKGNGLYEIERASDTETGIVTKLRAYGGTRNLDYSYPKKPEWADSVLPVSFALSPLRLMLPSFKEDGKTDFVLADEATIAKYGIRESSIIYEDIYPSITGATNASGEAIDEIAGVDEIDETKNTFTVYLRNLGFDLNEHLTTSEAQISMKTGTLQGYTFTITAIELLGDGRYKLTLGRNSLENSEESGAYVPSKNWNMKAGDKFVLLNILMPQAYIREAEQRLLARAKEYLAEYGKTNFSYNVGLHDKFLIEHPSVYDSLIEGVKLHVYDEKLGIREEVTIQSITITENSDDNILPQVKVTLNNKPSASTLDRIQGKLNDIANETAANGFSSQSELMKQYRKKLDKPFFDKLFSAVDADGNEIASNDMSTPIAYIKAKYDFLVLGDVTMYGDDGSLDLPSIYEGLPIDNVTLYWDKGVLKAKGGEGGGGEADSIAWANVYGKPSWITDTKPKYSYSEIEGTPDLSVFVTGTALSNTLADYATLTYLTGELKKYVTLDGAQDIKGVKNFVNGLKIGNIKLSKSQEGVVYLEGNLVVKGGVTMYALDEVTVDSIIDSLPLASTSQYGIAKFNPSNFVINEDGFVTIIGGSGGLDTEELADYLTTNKYATQGWVESKGYITSSALNGYATQSWVTNQKYITGITSAMVVSALGFTPYNSANFTKANIKSTLGISDWALASSKPSYTTSEVTEGSRLYFTNQRAIDALASTLANYVTLGTKQTITGEKNFTGGLKVNGSPIYYDATNKYWKLEGDLLVTGGVTMYGTDEGDIPSILDSLPIASTSSAGIASFDSTYFSVNASGKVTLTSAPSSISILGNLQDVRYNVSGTADKDVVLFKQGGTSEWTTKLLSEIGGGGSIQRPLRWTGYDNGTWNGSTDGLIVIPTSLKNPNALTFTGAVSATYDGSSPVTVNIPTAGGDIDLSNYLPLSGGLMTGDIGLSTINKASYNLGYSAAGAIDGISDYQHLDRFRTFIGSYCFTGGGRWDSVISVRHRNGYGDGDKYGFYLIQPIMTDLNRTDIIFRKQVNGTWSDNYYLLHSGNYSSYALPLSGGTLTGALNLANNVWNGVGSNSAIGSIGTYKGQLSIKSVSNNSPGIAFFNSNATHLGSLQCDQVTLYWRDNIMLHAGNYSSYALPLSGGTIYDSSDDTPLNVRSGDTETFIGFYNTSNVLLGYIGVDSSKQPTFYDTTNRRILTDANYSNYALPKDGTAVSASKVTNALSWSGYSSGSYNGSAAKSITIPSNTNQLTNGAGFITSSASITGNAGSATKLQTARTIWGQSFDGTGNVSGNLTIGEGAILGANGWRVLLGVYEYCLLGYDYAANNKPTYIDGSEIYLRYGTAHTEAMRISSSGNVGIGTTSPAYKLDVNGTIRFASKTIWGQSFDGTGNVDGDIGGSYFFISDSSINPYFKLVQGSTWYLQGSNGYLYLGAGSTKSLRIDSSGNCLSVGGITMYSDIRKKTKLQDVELSLSQIANAPLIQHYYNSDQEKTTHVGSIAQYWAGLNDWFCKLDNEGFYTMEIQNCALASAISIARHLEKYESKTDKKIRMLKKRITELEDKLERLEGGNYGC